MEFWAKLDEILAAHEIVIDRPAGSRHPISRAGWQ